VGLFIKPLFYYLITKNLKSAFRAVGRVKIYYTTTAPFEDEKIFFIFFKKEVY
jgi:hypothetical protein